MAAARRRFGRIRHLPSGRWQVRYPGPDGLDRTAPSTFAHKADADRWLANIEGEIERSQWADPLAQVMTGWRLGPALAEIRRSLPTAGYVSARPSRCGGDPSTWPSGR
ncbi:MAG TPA: hypothetical protein VHV82_18310 [Sporichthyaceae bacterium]|jgi:hypothetical protein|nr:hypothetical protein [Sporichthyaceae bacterium]